MTAFSECKRAWERIPVDDRAYIDARELLKLPDRDLVVLANDADDARYGGWRNAGGRWEAGMHDGLTGRHVLDFGCGMGLEARRLAALGNRVTVADINVASVRVAQRLLRAVGFEVDGALISGAAPFTAVEHFDVFYCNGVLHHIPWAQDVLAWAAGCLPADGEMRLMLYTDRARAWCDSRGLGVGEGMDFDRVYADWYDERALASILPAGWRVDQFEYITPNGWYSTAKVVRS